MCLFEPENPTNKNTFCLIKFIFWPIKFSGSLMVVLTLSNVPGAIEDRFVISFSHCLWLRPRQRGGGGGDFTFLLFCLSL